MYCKKKFQQQFVAMSSQEKKEAYLQITFHEQETEFLVFTPKNFFVHSLYDSSLQSVQTVPVSVTVLYADWIKAVENTRMKSEISLALTSKGLCMKEELRNKEGILKDTKEVWLENQNTGTPKRPTMPAVCASACLQPVSHLEISSLIKTIPQLHGITIKCWQNKTYFVSTLGSVLHGVCFDFDLGLQDEYIVDSAYMKNFASDAGSQLAFCMSQNKPYLCVKSGVQTFYYPLKKGKADIYTQLFPFVVDCFATDSESCVLPNDRKGLEKQVQAFKKKHAKDTADKLETKLILNGETIQIQVVNDTGVFEETLSEYPFCFSTPTPIQCPSYDILKFFKDESNRCLFQTNNNYWLLRNESRFIFGSY